MTELVEFDSSSSLVKSLKAHKVQAEVTDLDHHRARSGVSVETDYIITVQSTVDITDEDCYFDTFVLSKSFSECRNFAAQLKKLLDSFTGRGSADLSKDAVNVAKYCELVAHLMASQQISYLAKVSYSYVKQLAKQRRAIVNDILEATCNYFPSTFGDSPKDHPLLKEVAVTVVSFFLTDHCDADGGKDCTTSSSCKDDSTSGTRNKPSIFSLEDNLKSLEDNFKKIPYLGSALTTKSVGKEKSSSSTTTTTTAKDSSRPNRAGRSSMVIPKTRKERRCDIVEEDAALQQLEENENLNVMDGDAADPVVEAAATATTGAELTLADPAPVPAPRTATGMGVATKSSKSSAYPPLEKFTPFLYAGGSVIMLNFIKNRSRSKLMVDGDVELLFLFAAFCMGMQCPLIQQQQKKSKKVATKPVTTSGASTVAAADQGDAYAGGGTSDSSGRLLLQRSIRGTPGTGMAKSIKQSVRNILGIVDEESEDEEVGEEQPLMLGSPLPKLPEGVPVGSLDHTNCWSETPYKEFHVRGPKYFTDKKKMNSGPYVFENRGMDLFLTDTCPEHIGRNHSVFGGTLRDQPTFLINFRLPWGVLVFYSVIPDRFLPFLKACYDPTYDKSTLPDVKTLSPADRATARFLMGDDAYKNGCFKIVPVVVDGPWVVKQVIGGKPALIGHKVPINYVYQPEEGKKALYLEIDLDVAASSVARRIVSVARTYTTSLTIDLGFVIQANEEDELPEQMLMGLRIHRIDPLTAPSLPPMKEMFMGQEDDSSSLR